MKILKALKNERGGVDLGSVMTGVVIIGITGGVIAATTLGIIPAIQNNVAKSSLSTISLAQSSHKQGTGKYGTMQDLVDKQLVEKSYDPSTNENISADGKLCTVVYATGAYKASAKGASGKYYTITNTALKPVEYTNPSAATIKTNTCFETPSFEAYDMAFTIDTGIPGCTTYEFPIAGPTNLKV